VLPASSIWIVRASAPRTTTSSMLPPRGAALQRVEQSSTVFARLGRRPVKIGCLRARARRAARLSR